MKKSLFSVFCLACVVLSAAACGSGSASSLSPEPSSEWAMTADTYEALIEKYHHADFNEFLDDPSSFIADLSDYTVKRLPADYESWESDHIADTFTDYTDSVYLFDREFSVVVSVPDRDPDQPSLYLEYTASADLLALMAESLYNTCDDHFGAPEYVSIDGTDCTAKEFLAFLKDMPTGSSALIQWSNDSEIFWFHITSYSDYKITFPG
ncbi:MAG: hypothetical protein IKF99_01190 [Oscillospiraceae bacterium]|nr:hypothetical protein [Oscillospiraceae bacterium]